MHVTIYLDIILFICFICNGAILLLVSYILKRKQAVIRIVAGTIVATLFVPLVLYYPHSFFNHILGKGIYSLFIIIVTFGMKPLSFVIKNLVTFYTVSIIVGGSLLSTHYLVGNSNDSPMKHFLLYVENIYGDEISLVIIAVGFPLTLYITKLWSDQLIMKRFEYDQQFNITLEWNGLRHKTIAFLDSGNHLIDPLTNRPVVICDSIFMKQFFSTNDWSNVKEAIKQNNPHKIPLHLYTKLSIVPFKTVAGDNHYLIAIKPDKLTIETSTKKRVVKKVLVGIQLSMMTNDNRYHCLLHPQLIALKQAKMI